MPISVPSYTVDDLDRFPPDGNRYELLEGMLLVTPAPGLPHQVVTMRLSVVLAELLRPWPDVWVASPGSVVFRPKTRLEPDILVFRAPAAGTKWEAVRHRFLAVETKSRSTEIYDRDFKRPAYLDLGVDEVWRVDVGEKVILVSVPGAAPDRRVDDRLVWSPKGLAADLTIDVAPLFRGFD
ncbi:MAG: Uma2 family endonuclease [Gemmatimonadales bacterium]